MRRTRDLVSMICAIVLMASGVVARAEDSVNTLPLSFRLSDQDGRPATEASFRGKPTVMHFGFTSCPVICPTTLYEVSQILERLGPLAAAVNFVFVTIDPEHDTPALLKAYLPSFDGRIVGLSGDKSEIDKLVHAVGVTAARHMRSDGSYDFEHSVNAQLIDAKGRKVGELYMGSDCDQGKVLDAIRALISGTYRDDNGWRASHR